MNDKSEKTLDYWINLATQVAAKAHTGQFRNDRKTPYIKHPEAVARAVESRLKPIAWLHDVVEDTNVTIKDLNDAGFPSYIVDAVNAITHRKSDTNMAYWKQMLGNPDAVNVKIADIKANLNDAPSDYQKIKYERALKVFAAAGYSV
jgi:(p)ppGpp synthase/HD superfamily hydrolase